MSNDLYWTCSGQFKHKRMTEPGNVEINNPIYMRDYEDEDGGDIADGFSFDPDKVSLYLSFLILSHPKWTIIKVKMETYPFF